MGQISGRKYMVVTLTTTYCMSILGSLLCVILKRIEFQVFLALFTGLGTIVLMINEWYFKREDRKQENGKEQ